MSRNEGPPDLQRTVTDVTEVGGIPWNELKRKLTDPKFDKKTFMENLSKKDKAVLLKLAKAQKEQGDLRSLTPDASVDKLKEAEKTAEPEAKPAQAVTEVEKPKDQSQPVDDAQDGARLDG